MFHTLLMPGCMLCVLLILSSCSRVEPPSAVERPGGSRSSSTTTHTVADGETTLGIAQTYNMREDELVRINNIPPPFKLVKGQKLKVKPNSKNKTTEPAYERVQEEKEVEVTALNMSPTKGTEGFATTGSTAAAITGAATALSQQNPAQQPFSPPEGSPAIDKMAINPTGWQAPVTRGTVLYHFGDKLPNGTTCDGVTWKAPAGTPVMATSQGTVLKAGQEVPAYGNMVVIKHPDGKLSVYAHLKQIDKGVKVNKAVSKGQMLGQVGQSGQVNGPQLHFQIRSGDAKRAAIDPMTLIS